MNPFLKIDKREGVGVVEEPAPVAAATPTPVAEAPAVVEEQAPAIDPANVFADPTAQPQGMDEGQFGVALREKLSNTNEPLASPGELIEWSKTVGQEIVPNKQFYDAYRLVSEARRDGKPIPYGGVDEITKQEASDLGFNIGDVGTIARQAAGPLSFNFADEASSALKAIPDWLSGRKGLGEAYEDNWADANTVNQLDWQTRPTQSKVGMGVGIAASMAMPGPAMLTRVKALKEIKQLKASGAAPEAIREAQKAFQRSMMKDVAVGGAVGGGMGATAATGEGSPDDRFGKTGEGAMLGTGIGMVASPAVVAAERITRPIRERIVPAVADFARKAMPSNISELVPFVRNNQSVNALSRRLGIGFDPADARAKVAEQAELGIDATLFDVVDETGRNVIGNAGRRDGAREDFQNFAEQRTLELPERVQAQAGKISNISRTPEQLDEIIKSYRDKDIDLALAPIRNEPVELTQEVAQILSTREGQRAIVEAIGMESDAATRANLEGLRSAARQINQIDPRMPAGARQQIAKQIMANSAFDVNASDKISRALNRRAQRGEGDQRALFEFGRKVRDSARANPAYVQAMENYGSQSKSMEAIDVGLGGTADNGGLLNEPADSFVDRVSGLRTDSTARMSGPARNPEGELAFTAHGETPRMADADYDQPAPQANLGDFVDDPSAAPRSQPDWGPSVAEDMPTERYFEIEEMGRRPAGENAPLFDYDAEELARVAATTSDDGVADALEDHLRFALGDEEASALMARARGDGPTTGGDPTRRPPPVVDDVERGNLNSTVGGWDDEIGQHEEMYGDMEEWFEDGAPPPTSEQIAESWAPYETEDILRAMGSGTFASDPRHMAAVVDHLRSVRGLTQDQIDGAEVLWRNLEDRFRTTGAGGVDPFGNAIPSRGQQGLDRARNDGAVSDAPTTGSSGQDIGAVAPSRDLLNEDTVAMMDIQAGDMNISDILPDQLARIFYRTPDRDLRNDIENILDGMYPNSAERDAIFSEAEAVVRNTPIGRPAAARPAPRESRTIEFEPEDPNKNGYNVRFIRYKMPDGSTVTGSFSWISGQNKANVEVFGMNEWKERAGKFKQGVMQDIGAEIHKTYPQLKFLSGTRATGAGYGPAGKGGVKQNVRIDGSKAAPSERRLAQAGGAAQVRREAGKGISQAAGVAQKFASPDQKRRTAALVGDSQADLIGRAMSAELRRVRNANAQTTRQGAGRGAEDLEGTASAVNVLYNPTSPVAWGREALRFMANIGITEKDAKYIVANATDSSKTEELISQLERAGVGRLQAQAYVDVVRNAAARAGGSTEER